MDPHLETQAMLADSVTALLDRHHSTEPICRGESPPDLWQHFAELGLLAAGFSQDAGGLGLPFTNLVPVFQAFGKKLATTDFLEFGIIGSWLLDACQAPAGQEITPAIIDGSCRVVLAHTEPGAAGDIAFTRSLASQVADGWQVSGYKSVVMAGDRATHMLVPAHIVAPEMPAELGLFLIDCSLAGVLRHSLDLYDGSHAADIVLDSVRVPEGCLLARGAAATLLIELALDRGRAALCHEAVGLMEALLDLTLDYVKARKQFDRLIGSFQTMQHRLADAYMDVELARSAAELATDAIAGSLSPEGRMQTISAAKYTVAASARRAGQSAVQAHGGIALTREYVAGHYFKRLTMIERYLGSSEDHLERYIALVN